MSKSWYRSKTLWFNLITLALGVLGAVLNVLEDKVLIILFTATIALGNGVLRIYFTDTAIAKPTDIPK
jgi:uncharacterized membrane protein YbaN (DUF454 family)